MQNRYVGDVGDFAKYALLRALRKGQPNTSRLAVIWYLYPDESHNADGRHTSYLNSDSFRALDPQLHRSLDHLVRRAKRNVVEVKNAGVLPTGTIFFEELAAGESGEGKSGARRERFRSEWFSRAQAAAARADIVFLDPDNGIEAHSVPKCAPKAGKYVFWDEIEALWDRGHSLVIYHHLNRTMTVSMQARALADRFVKRLSNPPLLRSLLFRRGSCRHFWIVGQAAHAADLQFRMDEFLVSGWSGHFEVA